MSNRELRTQFFIRRAFQKTHPNKAIPQTLMDELTQLVKEEVAEFAKEYFTQLNCADRTESIIEFSEKYYK